MPYHFIGMSKAHITQIIGKGYIEFGKWLYIPTLNLLLVFAHQQCQSVQYLAPLSDIS